MKSPSILNILVLVLSASTQDIRCVKPNDSSLVSCRGQPCLALDQYTQETGEYFTTGSTFVFLAGNHTQLNTVNLTNISDITLRAQENEPVVIACRNVFILCRKVTKLIIVGLKFLLEDRIEALIISYSTDILINCTAFKRSEDLTRTSARTVGITHSTLTVSNSFFKGGAIVASTSNITLDNNVFTFNGGITTSDGGAVYAYACVLLINGNYFWGNEARYGGAISARECVLVINGSYFGSNEAQYGGAIVAFESRVYISGLVNSGNLSTTTGKMLPNYCNTNWCEFPMFGSTGTKFPPGTVYFINNEAYVNGGGVYLQRGANLSFGGSVVVFRNNLAHTGDGGAVYSRNLGSHLSHVITNSHQIHFIGNRARLSGGGIYIVYTSLLLGESTNVTMYFSLVVEGLYSRTEALLLSLGQLFSTKTLRH